MIRYSLKCANGHAFESWFASGEAFERLHGAKHVICPECGDTQVKKALMAPAVRQALSEPATDREKALAELRAKVEANSEYVGTDFATEARRIHDGDAPGRSIYGEARPEDAKALIEDGIPVAPLPFLPPRRTN
ncbi:DUF1178 family protein [Cereibacter sp. SYSU M97828]|nr:DUF1178 family protein [Cereibacter flavus]